MKSIAAALAAVSCAGVDAPRLDSVAPPTGRRGDAVVISGAMFCTPTCEESPVGTVDFGVELPQVRAAVVTWDDTAIQAVVPQMIAIGPTEIVVTLNDRSSNALAFEVIP